MTHLRGCSIWIGFDPRPTEVTAFAVARASVERNRTIRWPIIGVRLADLRARGLYRRETRERITAEGHRQLIDVPSIRDDYDGSMATEFGVSRFLVPSLSGGGLALFMDCDMLVRANICEAFAVAQANPHYAVMCVKHDHKPEDKIKMDGQVQSQYGRKNWSSFVIFNCDHPSNKALTIDLVNTAPGKDLHAFCWLRDNEIGGLDPAWNWLAGYSDPAINPKVVHWTSGTPFMPGYENVPYAEEGMEMLMAWAA